jgi:hypothetical protein
MASFVPKSGLAITVALFSAAGAFATLFASSVMEECPRFAAGVFIAGSLASAGLCAITHGGAVAVLPS